MKDFIVGTNEVFVFVLEGKVRTEFADGASSSSTRATVPRTSPARAAPAREPRRHGKPDGGGDPPSGIAGSRSHARATLLRIDAAASTDSAGRCATCASRSPTAATSAAATACRRRCSGASIASCAQGDADLRGDRADRARVRRARRASSGSRAASRSCGRTSTELVAHAGATLGADLTLTTNGSLLAQKARPSRMPG